jgi:hypothetical protein
MKDKRVISEIQMMKGAKMINIYIYLLFSSVSVSCSSDNIAKENCSLYSMSINAILDNYQMTHKTDRASSVPTNKE